MITKILKFGGSSVGSPEMIRVASKIVVDSSKKDKVAVVVSAFQGITDQLLGSAKLAASGDKKYKDNVEAIKKRHIEVVKKLIKSKNKQRVVLEYIEKLIEELIGVLEKAFLEKEIFSKQLDLVASFGERLSAFIISVYIQDGLSKKSYFVDARELVKTNDNFINAAVDFQKTNKNIKKYFNPPAGGKISNQYSNFLLAKKI